MTNTVITTWLEVLLIVNKIGIETAAVTLFIIVVTRLLTLGKLFIIGAKIVA